MGALDTSVAIVIFFIFVLTTITSFMMLTLIDNQEIFTGVADTAINNGLTGLRTYDAFAVVVMISLTIAVLVSSFIARTHPIFIVPAIILLALQVMIGAILTNTLIQFVESNATIALAADEYPLMLFISQNYPIWTLITGAASLVVTFGKTPARPTTGEIS